MSNDMIFGRCDAAGCHGTTAFITRGYLPDGTSPTYNEACSAHAGDMAANYLRDRSVDVGGLPVITLVRASIEPVPSAFPPIERCSECGERWPANVLDNALRCPICGANDAPRQTSCRHCELDIEWFPASAGQPATWIDRGGNWTCPALPGTDRTHEPVRDAR